MTLFRLLRCSIVGYDLNRGTMMNAFKSLPFAVAAVAAMGGSLAIQRSMSMVAGPPTPAGLELMRQLLTARDGAVIKLERKDYGVVTVPSASHASPVQIDARGARFGGLVLRGVSGLSIAGGTIVGPGGRSYGISISGSDNIKISSMTITGAHRGIVINKSHDVSLLSNTLTGLLSDGIDIALSHKILVRGNNCTKFSPTMDSYDGTGKLLKGGGDHPDCIQAWSRPEAPPTSDLTIEKNRIEGQMQGIFLGNHVRDGVDDGGFDRVIIRDNVIKVSMYHGIAVGNARDTTVTGNIVSTLPGGLNPKHPEQPVRAWIRVIGGNAVACGNIVTDYPLIPEARPCRKTGPLEQTRT